MWSWLWWQSNFQGIYSNVFVMYSYRMLGIRYTTLHVSDSIYTPVANFFWLLFNWPERFMRLKLILKSSLILKACWFSFKVLDSFLPCPEAQWAAEFQGEENRIWHYRKIHVLRKELKEKEWIFLKSLPSFDNIVVSKLKLKVIWVTQVTYCYGSSSTVRHLLTSSNLLCSTCMGRKHKIVHFMIPHPKKTYKIDIPFSS